MARIKSSVAEKKLKGIYRPDRHGEQEKNELVAAETCFNPDTVLEPPEELSDPYVIEYYQFHTAQLIQLRILSPSDIPELTILYETLEQLRNVQKQIRDTDIVSDFEKYEKLTKLSIKLGNRFGELAKKYYISPVARTRLQLDNLELEQKKIETQSVIGKILANKKS